MYIEIGKKVYTELKDGKTVTEEDILKKCDEISQTNDEIAKLKDKLLNIKKMKTCAKCGTRINKNDLYCPNCGNEQPKTENISVKENEPENVKEAENVAVSDVKTEDEENKE